MWTGTDEFISRAAKWSKWRYRVVKGEKLEGKTQNVRREGTRKHSGREKAWAAVIAEAKGCCLSDGQDEARLAGGKLGQQNTTENEEIAGKRFERSDGFRVHGLCTKACPAPAHSPPSVFVPLCPTACLSPLMTITQTKKATFWNRTDR